MKYDDIIVFLIYIILSLVLVLCRVQFDLCYFDKRPADDFKLTAFTESSLDHCLEECSRRSKCQAVGYHHLALFCELFSDSMTTSTVRGYVTVRREDMKLHDNKLNLPDKACNGSQENDCKRYECDQPKPFKNGKYIGNMNQIGSKRRIMCNDGFIDRRNRKEIKCSAKGEWNYVPVCRIRNRCETGNRYCGRSQACCNISGSFSCRSTPVFSGNSVCPVPADEWIPLRCSQISISTNEQSRIEARTKCTELKARLFRIDTTWKINFISSVLQNCNGFSGSTYWINGVKNESLTDSKKFGKTVSTDSYFWRENATNGGICIGLVQQTADISGNYRFDALHCNKSHRYICVKDIV